jgi:hypothetical protein
VLEICQRAGLLVIEDNPYGLLGFDGEPLRALRAEDPHGVVYLGDVLQDDRARAAGGLGPGPARDQGQAVLAAEAAVLCHSSLRAAHGA